MNRFIVDLKTNKSELVNNFGGKAKSLNMLSELNINIPNGVVITTDAFKYFLESNNIVTPTAFNIEAGKIPNDLSRDIVDAFVKHKFRKVAVRSSANLEDGASDSFAGELETYLSVDKTQLLDKIKLCWISAFSNQVLSYLSSKKIKSDNFCISVLIQEMVIPEVAGVSFTVDPITKNENLLLIEAIYGLGELLVSGKISPDKYLVNKSNLAIESVSVELQKRKITYSSTNRKIPLQNHFRQKLDGHQIIELTQLCKKIESFYKSPQDIEWALVNRIFYILQSRPITTLKDGDKS